MRSNRLQVTGQPQSFDGNRIWYGASAPSNPVIGDQWIDNNGLWFRYTSMTSGVDNQWLSAVTTFSSWGTFSAASQLFIFPVPVFGTASVNRMIVRRVEGIVRNTGAAHNSTNNYTGSLRAFTSAGGVAVINDSLFATDGMTSYRPFAQNYVQFLAGSQWFLFITALTKTGTPANIDVYANFYMQYVRFIPASP